MNCGQKIHKPGIWWSVICGQKIHIIFLNKPISHDWALIHDLSSIPRPIGQFWLPSQVLERVWIPSPQLVLHSLHVIHSERSTKIMTSNQKSWNLTYFFIRTKRSIWASLICSFAWFASYIQRLIRNTDHWFYLFEAHEFCRGHSLECPVWS